MRLTALYLGIGIATLAVAALWLARGKDQPARSVGAEPHATTAATLPAPDVMTYLYDAPETASDVRYEYHWEILSAALKATEAKWGAYRMAPAAMAMSEQRQTAELKAGTGRLTVMYLGTTAEFEKTLTPVKIPVDRDLGGYMVMLIRKEDQPKFSDVRTLDDLRKFKIGLGLGWVDVDILQNSKLDVVTGSNYDGLFPMLLNKRFDAFSRAAVEIGEEFDQRKVAMPEMQIESSFILYYPLPMYFWFSKTPQGQRLADRVQEGMMAMYDSGEYMKIFNKYQQEKITRLDLFHRRRIDIPNQNLDHLTVPWVETRLWFEFDKAPQ